MNNPEIILKCMEVNCEYMRLPAYLLKEIRVEDLGDLVRLYERIANQGKTCAQAWIKGSPCPKHEPVVDAFLWGIVAWADAFGLSVLAVGDQEEWGQAFISPHFEFANYLSPVDRDQVLWQRSYGKAPEPLPVIYSGHPADVILKLDALWMERVIKLTTKWGLMAHLKDKGALTEARQLSADLRNRESLAYKAYLESDLDFFRALFKNFPFSQGVRKQLDDFITRAEEVV